MPGKDDDLLKRLLATFRVEAQEHIQAIASRLVELEQTAGASESVAVIDAAFRAAHSLKGAARAVNAMPIEGVCQEMENVFAGLKRGTLAPSPEFYDGLHQAVDVLGELLRALDSPPETAKSGRAVDARRTLQALSMTAHAKAKPEPPPEARPAAPVADAARSGHDAPAPETVRVATGKLDAVLRQAEEMLAVKLSTTQRASRLKQLQARPAEWRQRWARLRSEVRLLQHAQANGGERNGAGTSNGAVQRVLEFLEWNEDFFRTFDTELGVLARNAEQDQRAVTARVDSLLEEMKEVVMQPFSTLLDLFPRLVREVSREQRKEVELVIRGARAEIDRRILDELKDPLIHLVRNALDHGIESPAVREARGKPPRGTLSIEIAARNGSHVALAFSDDGAGIDLARVKAAAVSQQLVSADEAVALGATDAVGFIFQPGLSTAPIVTDLSGRGLGLAIVRERIDRLNGSLVVESEPGRGTTFRLLLPATLARSRGVVIRAGGHLFVAPTGSVERVARVRIDEIKTVENRETIVLAGKALSLARLGQVLELPSRADGDPRQSALPVIVLAAAGQRIAFAVDEVVNEQEVLVKGLGPQLARVRNFAGATVLGTGKVVPILSVPDLLKSASRAAAAPGPTATGEPETPAETRSILVAEDSITSRSLLKSILEAAGYRVETAVDGLEAYTKLRSGAFDLVVSDVDMPRMNGFGLTAKIREDRKLAELPVVLVTALESRGDREHGIDVGASAYIVKSSFDQTNLLDVIRRFL